MYVQHTILAARVDLSTTESNFDLFKVQLARMLWTDE